MQLVRKNEQCSYFEQHELKNKARLLKRETVSLKKGKSATSNKENKRQFKL